MTGRVEITRIILILLLVVAAPTVGDIGSCGEAPVDLDGAGFFREKAKVDCARCGECSLSTALCTAACTGAGLPTAFPEGCFPIVHDGEVCLRAIEAASCENFTTFVADQGATIPTECNFCPPEDKP